MKALVLAGGFPQIQLIKELKKRNITVLLADYNKDPVAKKYADLFYQISTLDTEAVKTLAKNEKVDFIITVCTDQALLTVAKVSEELGLPCYIDYQTALNVTNKQYMKKRFVERGIPTAKYTISEELTDSLTEQFSFPLIVKPVDCNSSKGVIKVWNKEELEKAFIYDVNLSRTHTAIIEEYVDGQELTVDAYVENGIAKILSVSINEKIKEENKFVIFRQVNPAPLNQQVLMDIKVITQKIADSFHLNNTPLLVQMLYKDNKVYVIEFSARTGGGVKYILIKNASGFDVIQSVVDLTLGEKPHIGSVIPQYKYLINEHIYCKPGIFDHLEGFDELKHDQIILDYYLYKWKGAEFSTVSNSGDRIAGFTVVGDTFEEVSYKHKIANEKLRVIDVNGNDIARHDLLPEYDFEE